ncbi:hypothetical protein C3F09_10760 [candidate division GN15 bacterium]|uniref:RNA polymerase sigma-70 region 4 domain-containing protein n=1 Tax=candidate division GN15 bacterium TaxID=2072418 RepID=A0A855X135_9BACT|nr:MAG: hypothetical protein C3F09_10760 [candidate division GN15 bacterium]
MTVHAARPCDSQVVAVALTPRLVAANQEIETRRNSVARERVVYRNWLVELGYDPQREGGSVIGNEPEPGAVEVRSQLVKRRVREALKTLSSDEREIVERIHYMGQTYREISEKSGREIHRLESLHSRAIRRLRKELRPLVKQLYGIDPPLPKCVVCRSPMRMEIDRIIDSRDPRRSWRAVLVQIREECGLKIRSPQMLIGHKRYH